jgi:hypothetical protein
LAHEHRQSIRWIVSTTMATMSQGMSAGPQKGNK